MEEIEIPDYVNAVPSFWWWELDEFVVMVLCLIVGYVARGLWPLAGLLIGVVVAAQVKKWKRGEMDGAIPHILFSRGIIAMNKLYKVARHGVLWV